MIKVSVIVPVYNAGPHLARCLDSLRAQSMNPEEYEVIFIDDGSTDRSGTRLDNAAQKYPFLRVFHQKNSGWPGQPRNRGIDAARGDYVFFCDADDWLAPHALEALHRFAVDNGSDIVLGKMAGIGRPVPQAVFRQTKPVATLTDTRLMDSLTVHKLFRRAFLNEHGLRFAEGRRRLEDHLFMAKAYLEAGVISVYADEVCYFQARWEGNISRQPPHWPSYFADLEEAIVAVEERTEPGAFRDRLLSRWLRSEMVKRLSGKRLRRLSPDEVATMFDEAHRVAAAHFGDGVVAKLNALDRPVGRAIVAGALAEIWQRADTIANWQLEMRVLQVGSTGSILQLCGTIGIIEQQAEPTGGAEARLAALFPDVELSAFNAALITSTPTLDLENNQTGQRFPLPARFHGTGPCRSFTVDLDPADIPSGKPKTTNAWTFRGDFNILGLGGRAPLWPVDERLRPGPLLLLSTPLRAIELIADDYQRLELLIGPGTGPTSSRPARLVRRARRRARRTAGAIRKRLASQGTKQPTSGTAARGQR